MNHGSLFSGIGGFDLAAKWVGWSNILQCENNEFCQKILRYYWPKAKLYEDIKTTDFTIWQGKIDILTGGFPCQPYSHAGKRKGTEDDRHLWPEMLRAIREIQPSYIVAENVYGIVNWNEGLVFNEVQTDLEDEGYEVQPFILPACGKNAPHKRERIWIVAYNSNTGSKSMQRERENGVYGFEFTANTQGPHKQRNGLCEKQQKREVGRSCSRTNRKRTIANSIKKGLEKLCGKSKNNEKKFKAFKRNYNEWSEFPTQSPICSRDDGISSRLDGITFPKWRNESIKAYGNAIVPQVAYEIFKVIEILK